MSDLKNIASEILIGKEAVGVIGDYVGEDGLLRCGVCGGKKETIISLGQGRLFNRKVRCVCRCERELQEREEELRRNKEAQEKINALKKASLMDERLSNALFQNAEETSYNRKNLTTCRRYASNFNEMVRKKQGLLFWGDVGTGKSYAAACIANELMSRGVPVIMTSFVKVIDIFRSSEQKDSFSNILSNARLVVFDDLGAERSTEYAIEKVYDIVDSRYRSGLPMIVTTNMSMNEMLGDRDIRYSRIYDRIFEMCYPMQWTGPSWRKVKAKGMFDEMGSLLGG